MLNKKSLLDNFVMVFITSLFGLTLFFLLCKPFYNGDNFFMFANARVLLQEGFVTTDPLSMHSDFAYVIPQWCFSLIIDFLRTNVGDTANFYFMLVLFFIIFILMTAISRLVAGEHNYLVPAVICFAFFSIGYSYLRPYLVTVVCNLAVIFFLEKWKMDGNKKWLWIVPVISVIQINFHNSLWISLFLILMCYLAEEFILMLRRQNHSFWLLLMVAAVSFMAGFINPYGFEYMTYIFKSLLSLGVLTSKVTELMPSNFTFDGGLLCYILAAFNLVLGICLVAKKKVRIPIRYILLFIGFFIMAVVAVRNNLFFYTSGQILFMYLFSKTIQLGAINPYKWAMRFMCLAAVVIAALYIRMDITSLKARDKSSYELAQYLSETEDDKSIPVFSTFNTGSFLEFFEFKPYIDARAEVFGIENNGVKDIASEYVYLMDDATENEFFGTLDSYGFRYALSDSERFNEFFDGSDDYSLIKESGKVKLYERRFQ